MLYDASLGNSRFAVGYLLTAMLFHSRRRLRTVISAALSRDDTVCLELVGISGR